MVEAGEALLDFAEDFVGALLEDDLAALDLIEHVAERFALPLAFEMRHRDHVGSVAVVAYYFDLDAGTVSAPHDVVSSGNLLGSAGHIVPCGNGWFRCIVVWTPAAASSGALSGVADASANRTATAGKNCYAWQAQTLAGRFTDGGPLIRTTSAAASIGASDLRLDLADGDYLATLTFDDSSDQVIPMTVGGEQLVHPLMGALNRGVVRRTVVTRAS